VGIRRLVYGSLAAEVEGHGQRQEEGGAVGRVVNLPAHRGGGGYNQCTGIGGVQSRWIGSCGGRVQGGNRNVAASK